MLPTSPPRVAFGRVSCLLFAGISTGLAALWPWMDDLLRDQDSLVRGLGVAHVLLFAWIGFAIGVILGVIGLRRKIERRGPALAGLALNILGLASPLLAAAASALSR